MICFTVISTVSLLQFFGVAVGILSSTALIAEVFDNDYRRL